MGRRIDPATIAGWCLAAALVLFLIGPIVTVIIYAFTEQWRYPNLLPTRWGFRFWNVMLGRADVAEAISTSLAIAASMGDRGPANSPAGCTAGPRTKS